MASTSTTPYSLFLALSETEDYGSSVTEPYELQPTHLPAGCIDAFYDSDSNYNNMVSSHLSTPAIPSILANVQYLYENGIINWPNFTVSFDSEIDKAFCLPNCGLCTSHSGDSIYYVFNLLVIGVLLPIIGMCGIVGNSLSAFVYSRKCKFIFMLYLI